MLSESVRLDAELLKRFGVFSALAIELAAAVIGGYWLGQWVDGKLGYGEIAAIALPLLGLGYGVWRVLRTAKTWLDKR